MGIAKDIAQVLALTVIGIGLLALAWRDPAGQRTKLTVAGLVVLAVAVARVVVIFV